MEQRNRNPYANVDWANCKRFTGDTHVHCTEMKFYERLMRTGVDFVTISNYYPSAPYWPLAKMTRNYYRCHHEHGLMMGHNAMTDLYSPVVDGKFVPGPFDWNKILDGWKDEIEEEYRSKLPFVEGEKLFPPLPAGTVEAPNAEHHGVNWLDVAMIDVVIIIEVIINVVMSHTIVVRHVEVHLLNPITDTDLHVKARQ